MEQASDEEQYEEDITFLRDQERESEAQRRLLEECWDWLEAGLSLAHCRKLGWIDFRRRLAAHLGKDPAPW